MSQPDRETCHLVDHRDGMRCVRCGRSLYGVAASRHHRRRRSQSTKDVMHNVENLILLCGTGTTGCHGYVHGHPAESYEAGWLVHSWDDPLDIQVRSWRGLLLLDADGGTTTVMRTSQTDMKAVA